MPLPKDDIQYQGQKTQDALEIALAVLGPCPQCRLPNCRIACALYAGLMRQTGYGDQDKAEKKKEKITLKKTIEDSVDAMGGDHAPDVVIEVRSLLSKNTELNDPCRRPARIDALLAQKDSVPVCCRISFKEVIEWMIRGTSSAEAEFSKFSELVKEES